MRITRHVCASPALTWAVGLLFCQQSSGQNELPNRQIPDGMPTGNAFNKRQLETAEMAGHRDCTPMEKCEMCTFTDQKSVAACLETGRKQKMECTAFDGSGKTSYVMALMQGEVLATVEL